MRVAIVGSGISGLVVAHRLQATHDITLFEADGRVGGHTHTVSAERDGERLAIDTGFVVFNDWTYPNFCRLLEELAVPSRPTEMSFSVRDDCSDLEYNGHSLGTLFSQRRNIIRRAFYRMLADILRFNRQARRLAENPGAEITIGEFLARHRYSDEFARWYLLPMGAAIWSCPVGTFSSFPVRFIAEFYRNHGLLNVFNRPTWRVVEGGSRSYVDAITRGFRDRIRLNSPVRSVRRLEDRVEVTTHGHDHEPFDHVIFACHSDQALHILGDEATPIEREILGAFPYSRNVAVLHTDESILPRSRRAWASWNYRVGADAQAPPTVTYNMNILQGLRSQRTWCVTLNDESRIDPSQVVERIVYHHPIFTLKRAAAQARHPELLTANRTSFCGAYWGNGFHEDGVTSALSVVEALSKVSTKTVSNEPPVASERSAANRGVAG